MNKRQAKKREKRILTIYFEDQPILNIHNIDWKVLKLEKKLKRRNRYNKTKIWSV